jgi:hypothetical protein
MQVTVKIRVKPKPRAHRPIVCGGYPNSTTPEDPPRAAFFNRCFQQRIPGEPAPRFQLRTNAFVLTGKGNQIPKAAAAQRSDQLGQQARYERLSPNVQIDVGLHRSVRK